MKRRFNFFVVGVTLFFSSFINVDAKDITLIEVINKLNNSSVYNQFKKEGASCEISATSLSLDISCDLKKEGVYKTHFDLVNGYAVYYFDGNKNIDSTAEEALFDAFWIVQLADIVATNSGYSLGTTNYEKMLFIYKAGSNYQQYGLTTSSFYFNYGYEKGYGISNYKMYLNDGSSEKNKVEVTNTSQNNNNNNNSSNNNNNSNNTSSNTNTNNNTSTNNNSNTNNNNSSNTNNQNNTSSNNNTNSNNSNNNGNSNTNNQNNTSSTNNSSNTNSENNSSTDSSASDLDENEILPGGKVQQSDDDEMSSAEKATYATILVFIIIILSICLRKIYLQQMEKNSKQKRSYRHEK